MYFLETVALLLLSVFLAMLCCCFAERKREPDGNDTTENPEGDRTEDASKRQDRRFQLAMLKVSVVHERRVTFVTVLLAIGVSLIVFGLTILSTVFFAGKIFSVLGFEWQVQGLLWTFIGLGLFVFSACQMVEIKKSEKEDFDKINERFIKKPETEAEKEE
ncbi:MAG TPA: hypothetical protein VK487_00985 [Candidatus Bathyarchaeia archaeon]|nr:hypothetical protein [Candidatus Bathyarchaeia archaeon]